MTNYFTINTEAAIYKEGRWLVGVRSANEREAAGLLAFVGGTVEHSDSSNDTLENAVIREVQEEIGIKINVVDFVNSTSFVSKKGNHVVNIVFLCTIKSGEPRISDRKEMESLHWLTAEEIISNPNSPKWLRESVMKAVEIKDRLAR